MSFLSKAEQSAALKGLVRFARGTKRELWAVGTYLRQKRMAKPEGPIRVGFLCEYIPAWSKVKSVYEIMEADDRFSPVILCVPSNLKHGKLADSGDLSNDVYDYFVENGYTSVINTLTGPDRWLDLQQMGLSYIFYLRPYNYLLPPPYENYRVCRYSKICMVIYGMSMTEEVGSSVMDREFFRHVYCFFAETSFAMKKNQADGWFLHALGLQKSVFKGMPGIEAIAASRDAVSEAWDQTQRRFRVMWTPRWTTDRALGGSNFFEFGMPLMELAQARPDMEFLFRPHPLALKNFVATGEMTPREEEAFRRRCEEIPNLSLDERADYLDTMWNSDVLITDISGVMAEYFVMGKPVIYCAGNMYLTPAEHTARMLEGCYVVRSWEELKDTLLRLRQGMDPLEKRRRQLAREIYGSLDSTPSQAVVEEIAEDFRA
ncbi:MAG: CDP-glycerol glycerophosphotransferase family protein [Faecousia sp.]